MLGDLIVGDGLGTAGSAVVEVLADGQFLTPVVTINGFDGRVNLNGHDATFSGLTGSGAGTLDLGSATLTLAITTFSNMFHGVIQGSGNLTLASGSFYMFGSSPNSYTGLTKVKAGILYVAKDDNVLAVPGDLTIEALAVVNVTNDEQIGDSSTIKIGNQATLHIGAFSGGSIETVGPLFLDGGGVLLDVSTTLKLNGDVTVGPGAINNIFGNTGATLDLNEPSDASARRFDIPFSTFLTMQVPIAGTGGITKGGGNPTFVPQIT